jgi:prepilin-type processing-associated H-X9-DG protein
MCPSDSGVELWPEDGWNPGTGSNITGGNTSGRHSYNPVYGDTIFNLRLRPANYNGDSSAGWVYTWDGCHGDRKYECNVPRSMFAGNELKKGMESATDGTSNTIIFSERVGTSFQKEFDANNRKKGAVYDGTVFTDGVRIPTGQAGATSLTRAQCKNMWPTGGGAYKNCPGVQWASGNAHVNGLCTVMPPNFHAVIQTDTRGACVSAPSSNHTGGVNCAFGDGSVHFISETIDSLTAGETEDSPILKSSESGGVSKWGVCGFRQRRRNDRLETGG